MSPSSSSPADQEHNHRLGLFYALSCYLIWGMVPGFWKQLVDVPAGEVLAHRIIWTFIFLLVFLLATGNLAATFQRLKDRKIRNRLLLSALCIGINWPTYVWAVTNGYIVEGSLGYFINPLVNMLLGRIFLGEKLRPWQWLAVALAAAGIVYLTISYGQFPVIALILAVTFGFYGLIRKTTPVTASQGLFTETLILGPIVAGYLVYLKSQGVLVAGGGMPTDALLIAAGVVTVVPLLLFAKGAKLLPLTVIGFCQYLAPSMQLLIGVLYYDEPFTSSHLIAFGLIWCGIAIFLTESLLRSQKKPLQTSG